MVHTVPYLYNFLIWIMRFNGIGEIPSTLGIRIIYLFTPMDTTDKNVLQDPYLSFVMSSSFFSVDTSFLQTLQFLLLTNPPGELHFIKNTLGLKEIVRFCYHIMKNVTEI